MRLEREQVRSARLGLARGESLAEVVGQMSPESVSARDLLGHGREVRRAIGAFGPTLQPLLDDQTITDILINGTHGIWVDRGAGLERMDQDHMDQEEVRALAVRLAAAAGQRLDDASPIVDGTFEGGLRLHAVLPPIAAEGPLISLRTQRAVTFSLDALTDNGMVPAALRPVVDAMITRRANVMISGATGSGKTTLLAACLAEIPVDERILIIEESAELRPRHPHAVHLQVRRANVQGAGEITMSTLVQAAMRMRPDRIVLGECRGPEVREVLSALNTGHEGGWATIHANSATDVPSRLVALGALAGMGEAVVAAQAASALDAVIHLRRTSHGREISQIATLERRGGELVAIPALSMRQRTGSLHSCDKRHEPQNSTAREHATPAHTGLHGVPFAGGVVLGKSWPTLADRLGLGGARWGS
ncbi:TadA family conjugal transfer-associated ATPase [Neoactinobaculum massilliense]|uniref:TadA family conjugal transfer-associated ATPase n=1 Tax=Neoactinobaculum massilliense TaxID=2364794 RepID=UPI000F52B25F|nr:TadA family conjugal transfer-associated ATPase [Neoactinobaculum massilliense]